MNRFSTADSIQHLSEQRHCSDEDIVNLIHVYYANYISDGNPNSRMSMREIKEIYQQCQSLMENFRLFSQSIAKTASANYQPSTEEIKKEFRSQLSQHLRPLWDSLVTVRYQMRMLGDVGATLLFVSDIVNRTLDERSSERFIGVDLGTGTGILLAAQDILARKNGYQDRKLTGIEYSADVAWKTGAFCHELGYQIVCGDSTSEKAWKHIPQGPIHFISNENVPAANEGMHNEPFFQNMTRAYQSRSTDISEKTGFSPASLHVIKDPETCDQSIVYEASRENKFCHEVIEKTRDTFLNNGLGDFLSLIKPDTILLEGKHIPLHLVSKLGAERLGDFSYERTFMSRF